MPSIALIAKQSFEHGGRHLQPGERFETTPAHAAALTYQRKAAFAPAAGQLQTRDLAAAGTASEPDPIPVTTETPAVGAPPASDEPITSTRSNRRQRRQYRRRDMVAEP